MMQADTIEQAAQWIRRLTGANMVHVRQACWSDEHSDAGRLGKARWEVTCYMADKNDHGLDSSAVSLQAVCDLVELRQLRRTQERLQAQLADALAAAATHGATQSVPPDPTGRGVEAEALEATEQDCERVQRTAHFCNACGQDRTVSIYPGGAVLCEECARYVNLR